MVSRFKAIDKRLSDILDRQMQYHSGWYGKFWFRRRPFYFSLNEGVDAKWYPVLHLACIPSDHIYVFLATGIMTKGRGIWIRICSGKKWYKIRFSVRLLNAGRFASK